MVTKDQNLTTVKVVLHGSPRYPDIHDLSEYHRLYDSGRHTEQPYIKAAPVCQKSSPSYQVNGLNFDFKKISMRSVEDHLNFSHIK